MSQMTSIGTRLKYSFIWHFSTVELTAGGAWSILNLCPLDSSGTGWVTLSQAGLLGVLSTYFDRYRVHSLTATFCGSGSGSVTETQVLKFVPEALTTAAESSDWYAYTEGADMAVRLPAQTIPVRLHLPRNRFVLGGMDWLQTDSAVDNTGCAGSLVFFTSNNTTETMRIKIDVDIEFAGLKDPDITLLVGRRRVNPLALGRILRPRVQSGCRSTSPAPEEDSPPPPQAPAPSPFKGGSGAAAKDPPSRFRKPH